MSGRASDIQSFLAEAGWSGAALHPMPSDLSARSYARLVKNTGQSAILMDAPPERDPSTPAFIFMTHWLRDATLNTPVILHGDGPAGLLILEDLGDIRLADAIRHASTPREAAYLGLLDVLVMIRCQTAPDLHCPDAAELVTSTKLADAHYPGIDAQRLAGFREVLTAALTDALSDHPPTVSLRDFHAENVMWLPDRPGLHKFGLLDYQDAFLTHPAYDLVSLLTDARTDIDPEFRRRMIDAYQSRTDDDPERLARAFAAFSALRNLRILAIFARAATLFGKSAHVGKLPRVHGYFVEALDHPLFDDVRHDVRAAVPAPTQDVLDRFL